MRNQLNVKKRSRIKEGLSSRVFDVFNISFLFVLGFIMIYPFLYVLFTSISDPVRISKGNVRLFPLGFSLASYGFVLKNGMILNAYKNSVIYTVVSTLLTLTFTTMGAYVLSIPSYKLRRVVSFIFTMTLFIPGGMIPRYLVISNLGLLNTIWALVLPGIASLWYVIILRTSFSGIANDIRESAKVDGAGDFRIYWQIMLPLAKASISTIALFAAVSQWNNLFGPLLYLENNSKMPLTIYLRNLLIVSREDPLNMVESVAYDYFRSIVGSGGAIGLGKAIKMTSIVVTILPVIMIYPFIQKYFTKGVMIGSLKG